MKETRILRYDFRGAYKPPAVASRQGPWCSKITAATGAPTIQTGSSGAIELALDATNEVQNLCLYMGDVLPFDIEDLIRVEFLAAISASLGASVMAAFGVADTRNDTLDTIAKSAWFRIEGNNNVLCESDDGTTDTDDKATGETLSTTFKRFAIDFSVGNNPRNPPSLSQGGLSDLQFFMSNSNNSLRRVASGVRFDVSAYAGQLQLFAQIQKTAGTALGTLSILGVDVELRLPA